jgi:hypothetical protein
VTLAAATCSPPTDDPTLDPTRQPPRVVYAYDDSGRLRAVTDVESATVAEQYAAVRSFYERGPGP